MTARTHDIIALASLITLATLNPPESLNVVTVGAVLVGNVVGALIPDIDQATNRLWDLTPVSDFTGNFFRKLFISHRSISHSFLGLVLILLILQLSLPVIFNPTYINYYLVLESIMIGYISHLAADLFTKDGLPLLFPLKYKFGLPPVKSLRVTTNSFFEKYVLFPAFLVYIFWFIGTHQTQVLHLLDLINS